MVKLQRASISGGLGQIEDIYIAFLPLRFRKFLRRGGTGNIRAGGWEELQQKECLLDMSLNSWQLWLQDRHKLKPANITTRTGRADEIPTPAEEFLAADSCQQRESQYSLRLWPPAGRLH